MVPPQVLKVSGNATRPRRRSAIRMASGPRTWASFIHRHGGQPNEPQDAGSGMFRACRAPAAHLLGGPRPREQSQDRQSATADPPPNFHAEDIEDDQAAVPSLPQFRV